MHRSLAIVAALAAFGFVALALATPARPEPIEVIDGDTVRLNGERARVLGCDAPETTIPETRCDAERERGRRAAARLRAILSAGRVETVQRGRDRYKRPLVRITVDGVDVCDTLTREGLAVPYRGRGPRMDWCPRNRGRR